MNKHVKSQDALEQSSAIFENDYPVNCGEGYLVPDLALDDMTGGDGIGEEDEAVGKVEAGEDCQEKQPEPDEHVQLLVDNVHWQHTERVVGLQ